MDAPKLWDITFSGSPFYDSRKSEQNHPPTPSLGKREEEPDASYFHGLPNYPVLYNSRGLLSISFNCL